MDLSNYLPPGARDFLERHPKFKLAFRSFSYLFSERIIKILIGFFVHALLARHLGPVHFGKLSYIVKTVTVFFAFGTFGVDELIIKHLMEGKHSANDIMKTVLRLRLKMGAFGLLVLAGFLLVFRPEGWIFSILTFIYGINIIFQAFNAYELKFHAAMDFQPLFWANNFSYLSASFLRVAGVLANMSMTFFLATYIWGESVLKFFVLKRYSFHQAFSGKFIPGLARSLSKNSFPFFLSSFIMLLDQRLSFFFIEKFRSLTELGNYSVAVTLVDLWVFLPAAVCSAVFPTIVTAHTGNSLSYGTRVQYLSDIMVWIAIGFTASLFLISDVVIRLLYGERYQKADEALWMFASTTIPVFFNLARIKWMTLENKLQQWLWINVVCMLLNLIGHFFLVPIFGIRGAISSYLVSQAVGNLLLTMVFDSSRKSFMIFLKSMNFPLRFLQKIR